MQAVEPNRIETSRDRESTSIRVADASISDAWDRFVQATPGGSFYQLFDWKHVNHESFGHPGTYLAATATNGEIVGVLPLVLVGSRLFGRILCSMPFMNSGGPIAKNATVRRDLANRAVQVATEIGADYLELRCTAPVEVDAPVSLRKISMTVNLKSDPAELWSAFTSKHRKNIRRAMKNDLECRSGRLDLLPDFFHVLERSWHSLGTPLYRRSYFAQILKTFPEQTRIFVCYHQGRPAAAAMNGFSLADQVVEGMWAGVDPALRKLQPNYVLYWEMLRWACQAGHKKFHLGRSTAGSGAEQFKERWRAEPSQLYWYFHRVDGGKVPELHVDNPKYKLAIAAWKLLPLWVTRRVGPPVARLIP